MGAFYARLGFGDLNFVTRCVNCSELVIICQSLYGEKLGSIDDSVVAYYVVAGAGAVVVYLTLHM